MGVPRLCLTQQERGTTAVQVVIIMGGAHPQGDALRQVELQRRIVFQRFQCRHVPAALHTSARPVAGALVAESHPAERGEAQVQVRAEGVAAVADEFVLYQQGAVITGVSALCAYLQAFPIKSLAGTEPGGDDLCGLPRGPAGDSLHDAVMVASIQDPRTVARATYIRAHKQHGEDVLVIVGQGITLQLSLIESTAVIDGQLPVRREDVLVIQVLYGRVSVVQPPVEADFIHPVDAVFHCQAGFYDSPVFVCNGLRQPVVQAEEPVAAGDVQVGIKPFPPVACDDPHTGMDGTQSYVIKVGIQRTGQPIV